MLMKLFKRKQRDMPEAELRNHWPGLYHEVMGGLQLLAAYGSVDAGVTVTPETALRAAAVNACVGRISRDLATLPRRVIDRKTNARADHPVNRLLNAPNGDMTGAQFWQAYTVNLLLYGNGYAHVGRAEGGSRPVDMFPMMSKCTEPRRVNGLLFYDTGMSARVSLRADEVAHVPLLSLDGVCGVSPIRTAAGTVGTAIALDEFAARYFGQGAMLSQNAFELPDMSGEALKETRRLMQEEYGGVQNAHKLLAAPGLKVHRLSHSMRESQAIEARDWQRKEICALYGVPIGIIDAEKSKYAGLEAQYRDYAEATLRPLAVQIEEEFSRKLLSEADQDRYVIRFNLDAMVRASLSDRMSADAQGVQAGILTPNEARAHHDLPPVAGGDTLMSPLNMTPAAQRSGELAQAMASSLAIREAKGAAAAAKKAGLDTWASDHANHLSERLPFLTRTQAEAMAHEVRDAFAAANESGTLDDLVKSWPQTRAKRLAGELSGASDNLPATAAPTTS